MYFLYYGPTGSVNVYTVESMDQASYLAGELGISASEYAVFNNLDALPSDWQLYPRGVTLTLGASPSYGYALENAKEEAKVTVKIVNAEEVGLAANNLSSQLLTAQATLPEIDRMPEAQAAIANINVLAAALQSQMDAIDAATSIAEIDAVVNPSGISGEIFIDRDGLTLGEATFVSLVGATAASLDFFIVATATVLAYDAEGPGTGYSSGFDVFGVDSYLCYLRSGSTVIATFDVTSESGTIFPFSYTA